MPAGVRPQKPTLFAPLLGEQLFRGSGRSGGRRELLHHAL
jgi:hypothetical protein